MVVVGVVEGVSASFPWSSGWTLESPMANTVVVAVNVPDAIVNSVSSGLGRAAGGVKTARDEESMGDDVFVCMDRMCVSVSGSMALLVVIRRSGSGSQ